MLFTRLAPALVYSSVFTFVLIMPAHFKSVISSVVILLFNFYLLHCKDIVAGQSIHENNTRSYGYPNSRALEVPDSPLLLLDRTNFKQSALKKYYARQNQDNETTSSTSPCSCKMGVCKCCTGYVMNLFNQKACMKVTYNPGDFAFDVQMTLNNIVLYENSMSGKNPKPVCINPPRLNNLKMCGKFYNVFFPGRNFHFCLSMYGQWRQLELFNVAFDCMRMGAQGIAMVKPDDAGNLNIPNPQGGVDAVIDAGEDDIEDYDENLVRSLFGIFDD